MREKITYASNVISEENTEEVINYTLNKLANSLSKSLGPYGSHTILQDGMQKHNITKDGYTIFDKINIENDISKTILQIIKNISRSLVKEVGDGSTSSVIISCSLYDGIKKFMHENTSISPKTISDTLNELELIITEKIKDMAIPIDEENFDVIRKIASISNNNDIEIGTLIEEVYRKIGKNGFITLENSKSDRNYYKISNGYEFKRGYILDYFINNKKTLKFEAENPLIFVSNSVLNENDLQLLADICGYSLSNKKQLIIIAKEYTDDVINFLQINKLRNKDDFEVCPVDYILGTDNREESLKDFACYVGATIYDKLKYDSKDNYLNQFDNGISDILGSCNKAIIDEKYSQFIEGNYDKEKLNDRIEMLNNLKKNLSDKPDEEINSRKIFEIDKRISELQCNNATIYIGGKSEMEKNTRKYLVDDAINAVRSALEFGYVIGGNLAVPFVIESYTDDIANLIFDKFTKHRKNGENYHIYENKSIILNLLLVIEESFLSAYKYVLRNCFTDNNDEILGIIQNSMNNENIFNLITFDFESINDTDVINSADTDIEIMKSAFSIIGLLVTSNQFISLTCYDENAFK